MHFVSKASRAAAGCVLTLLALGAFSASAHAVLLNIDSSQSSVTYSPGGWVVCDPDGNCGTQAEPQTFALSGSFELTLETVWVPTSFSPPDGYEREEIRFESVAVDSGDASSLGFVFPRYDGIVTGQDFVGYNDSCFDSPSGGGCWILYPVDNYAGTFDGTTLSMTGFASSIWFNDASTFTYTVVARAADVAPVSEPGALACLLVGAMGLGAVRRSSSRGHG